VTTEGGALNLPKGGGVRERNSKKDSGLLNFIENICKEGIIRPVVR